MTRISHNTTGLSGELQVEIYPKYMLPDDSWTTDPAEALRLSRKADAPEIQLKAWLGEHYTAPGEDRQ